MDNIIIQPKQEANACVIWLHGLGADGNDFVSIVPELCIPQEYAIKFIFPTAPVRSVTINGGAKQRAWFDILSTDRLGLQSDRDGIIGASNTIKALINAEVARGIASERIVVAGFSQGGVVALYTALTHATPLAGAMGLSTYLPAWVVAPASPTPLFLAHGTQDPILPEALGLDARQRLLAAGCTVDWHQYPMDHNVCAEETADIAAWLMQRLK